MPRPWIETLHGISYLRLTRTLAEESRWRLSERLTTTVSTKGQVILPKALRRSLGWEAGTRLVVEDTPEGVLLRPEPVFAETRPEDVFGLVRRQGRAEVACGDGSRESWRKQSGATLRAIDTNAGSSSWPRMRPSR